MKKISPDLKREAMEYEARQREMAKERLILNERDKNKILTQDNRYLIGEIEKLSARLGEYDSIKFDKHKPSKIVSNAGSGKSESTIIACASDWHVGERIDIESVNGVNEFNPGIATIRAKNFFKKLLTITHIFRGSTKIKNLVLWLGGDFISGYIHEELLESNYMSPSEEVEFSYSLMVAGIDYLLAEGDFDLITIPCNVGNHGRTTLKSRVSTAWSNSFEAMLYTALLKKYDGNKLIKFSIVKSYHNIQDIYGRIIRFHHGDAIRYSGGVGGLTIPALKAISQWNRETSSTLDIFGHYHQLFYGGNFLCNGCLAGYGAYAKFIKATYESPSQGLLIMEKDHGITSFNPLYV